MADNPFWTSGSIPNEAELRNYLGRESHLTPEEIATVVAEYRRQVLGDPDITRDWPQMAVNSWVSQQISNVMTDPRRVEDSPDELVTSAIAEHSAQQEQEDQYSFGAITEMARERLRRQSQTFYDQANALNDAGPNKGASL